MNKRYLVILLLLFSLPLVVGKIRQQNISVAKSDISLEKSTYYADLKEEGGFESELVVRCFTYTPDDAESTFSF
jgi:hypothetical protein